MDAQPACVAAPDRPLEGDVDLRVESVLEAMGSTNAKLLQMLHRAVVEVCIVLCVFLQLRLSPPASSLTS